VQQETKTGQRWVFGMCCGVSSLITLCTHINTSSLQQLEMIEALNGQLWGRPVQSEPTTAQDRY